MSNNKDFKLKNAVEVGGPTKVTLGTVTSGDIDLSTGNYFAETLAANKTYALSNAGDVQSFQLEVTGGTAEVAQNFSTDLYTGNGSTQTITNGIDLAGEGGLVWIKPRNQSQDHILFDTERGVTKSLTSNSAAAEYTATQSNEGLSSFNSDGFALKLYQNNTGINNSAVNAASWTFRKAPKFFDVVTYTGNGTAGRTVSHNLGSVPGCMIIKKISSATDANWAVYHRETVTPDPAEFSLLLNSTAAAFRQDQHFNDTEPTSTEFTLGSSTTTNLNGEDYVAYLFAHDDASDSLIKCGSYTSNSGGEITVDLGFEPQWILLKNTAGRNAGWVILDTMRGFSTDAGNNLQLLANANYAELDVDEAGAPQPTATGFKLASSGQYAEYNYGTDEIIYMAIRAASDLTLTWPSSIEWANGAAAPAAPAVGETDLYTFSTDDGGTTYTGIKTGSNFS